MEFYYHDSDGGILVLSADGGLDAGTAEQFESELEKVIRAGVRRIIVDCSHLAYISSFGISTLIRLHKRLAKRGGDVKLANINSRLVALMSLSHIDRFFNIYPDVSRARLAFRPGQPHPA